MRIAVYACARGGYQLGNVLSQAGEIRRWAAENGHHVSAAYRDVGYGADDTYRDGFMLMLQQAIVDRSFDAIVVTDYTRLSRDPVQYSRLLSALAAVGVNVISISDLP